MSVGKLQHARLPNYSSCFQASPSPRGFKSHLPYHHSADFKSAKYIYMYRNPKDVLVSNYHFTEKFLPYDLPWNFYFQYQLNTESSFLLYGNLIDHVKGWYEHKGEPAINQSLIYTYVLLFFSRCSQCTAG